MRYDWLAIAGETLNDRYVLSRFEDEVGGVGRYVAGDRTVDILPVAAPDSREIAERWQFLRSLAHPNLLSVVETGTADLAGVDVVYCVTERPEDTVASVLPERSLTKEETDQIADSILPALRYLSANGAVYAKLSATEITAVGDQVKLALDPVEPVRDRISREWSRPDLEQVLSGRSIIGLAEKPAAPPPPPPPARPAVVPAPPPTPPKPVVAKPVPPVAKVDPPLPARQPEQPVPPPGVPVTLSTVRKVALIATAVVSLGIVFQFFRSRDAEPAPAVDTTRSSPVAPAPSPDVQRPVAPPPAAKPVAGWTVVVGAYGRQQDANKRAAALADKWNHGPIQVVRSKGRYLLVAATGLNSKAEADRVRREARSAGLSRSAYVTRL